MIDPGEQENILFEALRLSGPERRTFLDAVCAGDAERRRRLETELQQHEAAADFFDGLKRKNSIAFLPGAGMSGERFGHYQLLEQIGEGGCGVVYRAAQEAPVRREVAVKVLKPGMDTKEVVARFEAERQALALMDHPNIARVFDAGATEAGRPYFVMELVQGGTRITAYCNQHGLSTADRLKLFVQVCFAIQHAHQKGVVHRDIKPSNVLITVRDGAPVPKVIDFGIAKATRGRLTDHTVLTGIAQFMGTPAYMSPEQAAMGGVGIDARTDIYSLGVLLYELLTGRTPFDNRELQAAGLDEMRRVIREEDPPPPSQAVAENRGAATALDARGKSPATDLDWIVMKALEKDPARRYQTAGSLGSDVERYLQHEPVAARPPTKLYRLRKMVRRNKLAFAAGAAVVVALITGLSLSTWSWLDEREARREAVAGRKQAQIEAEKSRQIARFLEEMLAGVKPATSLGRDTTLLREILDKTSERLGRDLAGQPEVEIELRTALSKVYGALGQFGQAEEMSARAVDLARLHLAKDDLKLAFALASHGDALTCLKRLPDAERVQREAIDLKRRYRGNEQSDLVFSLRSFARLLALKGEFAEAEACCREAVEIEMRAFGPVHPRTGRALADLAEATSDAGKPAEAERMWRQALEILCRAKGDDDPLVAAVRNDFAMLLERQGRLTEAEELLSRALASHAKTAGYEHPGTAAALHNLGDVFRKQAKFAEAEMVYRQALDLRRKLPCDSHGGARVGSATRLAGVLEMQGKIEEAEHVLSEALAAAPEGQAAFFSILRWRGEVRARRTRFDAAATDLIRVVEARPEDADAWHWLAVSLVQSGQMEAYRRYCGESARRFAGTEDPLIADRIAKDCLILPFSGVDLELLNEMTGVAIAKGEAMPAVMPWFRFCRGLCEYRRGEFANAAVWMEQVVAEPADDFERDVEAWAVLAMARHRLGQRDEARAALIRARKIAGTLRTIESGDLGGDWIDWIIAQALLREAEELLDGGVGKPHEETLSNL